MLARGGAINNNVYIMNWSNLVPLKCNVLWWRAEMGRIAIANALKTRNIDIEDDTCSMCNSSEESARHLFCFCYIAARIWHYVGTWCRVSPFVAGSVGDLLEKYKSVGLTGGAKEAFECIVKVWCWCIWRARNKLKFENKQSRVEDIIKDVKATSFLWYSNRSKSRTVSWNGLV
ncbi:uncharacterized protein LOC110886634 [Helianthus annuus]|uniref:uncharacterized protein LOC110886634 n=1 Tax=Helianthus annuus TaxID=4232 RepID=UPI000B8F0764|nr:uncharacterized protein LOC110886634 [Helianthus annuus]